MRNFILGTDWWTDCDDAVAMRLVTRFLKEGKMNLLGIGMNGCMPYSVASLTGFLKADGVENIPIGLDVEATDFGGNPPYQKGLAEKFGQGISNEDAQDAVRLYRKLLCQATEPVEILEIGYPQVLAGVLQSGGDDISEKSGVELFQEKVSKVWMMAGKWDADGEKENNFCRNHRSRTAGKLFCELCPVPVTFLGWEVGVGVITGSKLSHHDHLYQAMVDHGSPNGRYSWDPMLILLAVLGDPAKAGYDVVQGTAFVNEEDGTNRFVKDEKGNHQYVVKQYENSYYEEQIDSLL